VPGISCIVCAYNEADRIEEVLRTLDGHPALGEVIVVDDGSTDDTKVLVQAHPNIRLVSYRVNRGKTYAMSRGIAAAKGEHLMFLDADLAGLGPREIDLLAAPIAGGCADVSISLRSNSLAVYRRMGLDFVSGERVIPAWLVRDEVETMAELPRWGGETFINQLVIAANLEIEVVDWPGVTNTRKQDKVGALRGLVGELSMINDALQVLSPLGLLRQNVRLLRLVRGTRRTAIAGGRGFGPWLAAAPAMRSALARGKPRRRIAPGRDARG
jgi:glycosyltransferase involved in cell wall biosynthesis